jgi:hypothetical protein
MEPATALPRTMNDRLPHAAAERLFKLPRDEASHVALSAVEPVRQYFVTTGATLRKARL